jgi:hypothetical protein
MSERGVFAVDRGIFDHSVFAREPFTQREAWIWLGFEPTTRLNKRRFATAWGWPVRNVMPFINKMVGAGFLRLHGDTIFPVALSEAIAHPELVVGESWRHLRLRVLIRDNFTCAYCGSTTGLAADHVHPRAKGGLDIESNLVAACKPCNSSKRDKTIEEWRR